MKLTKDDVFKIGMCLDCEDNGLTPNPECVVISLHRLREVVCEFRKTRPYNLLFQEDLDDAFGEVLRE